MAITLEKAAATMKAICNDPASADVVVSIDLDGVQAYVLKNKLLAIPGTNEFLDWFRFNFNVTKHGQGETEGWALAPGDSGRLWHAGFLKHAKTVYSFAKPQDIEVIIGHSLGGASAQIVGSSLKIPTITFGSPATFRDPAKINGEGWVINLCRTDDTVCDMPPERCGFRHVGSRYWLHPPQHNKGVDHDMDDYITAIEGNYSQTVPAEWPPKHA